MAIFAVKAEKSGLAQNLITEGPFFIGLKVWKDLPQIGFGP